MSLIFFFNLSLEALHKTIVIKKDHLIDFTLESYSDGFNPRSVANHTVLLFTPSEEKSKVVKYSLLDQRPYLGKTLFLKG